MKENTSIGIELLASLRDTEGYKNWMRDKVENSTTPWREYIEALLKFSEFPKIEGHGFTKEQAELFDEYMYSFAFLFTEQYYEGEPLGERLREFVNYLMYESRYKNVGEKLVKAYVHLLEIYEHEGKKVTEPKTIDIPHKFLIDLSRLYDFLDRYGWGKVENGKFVFSGDKDEYAYLVERISIKYWGLKARNKFAEMEEYFSHPNCSLEYARNRPQRWHKDPKKKPKNSESIVYAINFKIF